VYNRRVLGPSPIRLALVGAVSLSLALVMCRDATQMVIEVSTDLPCTQHGGTAVVVGKLGALDVRSPTTFASTCKADGTIGTLVIVPSGDDDAEIAFQVTSGIGVDPATCTGATTSASCIVSRRSLRFLPHESVRVRVPMRKVCAGVVCDPAATCFNGACVSAAVDANRCTGAGCGEEALGTGTAPSSDAGIDSSVRDGGPLAPSAEIVMGEDHTCALVRGGVFCWGSNELGQLGIAQPAVAGAHVAVPTAVPGLANVASIATAGNTTAALMSDGTVYGWGDNVHGQLPDQGLHVDAPVAPTKLPRLVQVCVGRRHGCGLDALKRTLTCWGAVSGVGGDIAPTPVDLGAEAVNVTCGDLSTVVWMKDGTIRTLGDATAALGRAGGPGTTPVVVPDVTNVLASTTGWYDTFVSLGDGGRQAWGKNLATELTVSGERATPLDTPLLAPFTSIVAGVSFACGLKGTAVFCWGDNTWGQLGQPQGVSTSGTPVPITLAGPVSKLWGGGNHACARLEDGRLYCWGANDLGQLGDGTSSPASPAHPTPVLVTLP
jgi:hypothetical protein